MKKSICKQIFPALLLISILMTSCYKEQGPEDLADLDVILTYYDNDCDFGAYHKFIIRDSCVLIRTDDLSQSQITKFYSSDGGSQAIRNKVINELTALGYQKVDSLANADFGVNMLGAVVNNTVYVSSPYWWWDYGYYDYWGWYGGYYPYYGDYYGYYPWSYIDCYSYDEGTIMIEMVDGESLRNYRSDSLDLKFVWQALINGVVSKNASYNAQRVNEGIEQAFEQSPYLGSN